MQHALSRTFISGVVRVDEDETYNEAEAGLRAPVRIVEILEKL
jgi:hypothetical protein